MLTRPHARALVALATFIGLLAMGACTGKGQPTTSTAPPADAASGDGGDDAGSTAGAPDAGELSTDAGPGVDASTDAASSDAGASDASSTDADAGDSQAPTYHGEVRAILEANCLECHRGQGIAPFTLDAYDEAAPLAHLLAAAVESGSMPPWPPQQGCGDFRHARTLSAAEIAAFRAWADAGAPEGDPADYVAPPAPEVQPPLGPPDLVVQMAQPYTPAPPAGGFDDYRCFPIPTDLGQDRFLNAFEVHPGDQRSVHHVLFWAVEPTQANLDRITQRDGADAGPGWTCFGGNRVDDMRLIGGWVPGSDGLRFDPGQGLRVPTGSVIVMQVHYNTANGAVPDQTSIDLHFTDGPATTPLGMYPLADFGLFLPAGDANATAGTTVDLPFTLPLYGLVPHMHLLGSRISVKATLDGQETCLIDIPDWDFDWQGFYLLDEPMRVQGGTQITLECEYDNSAANQPAGQTPRDVTWGEGTYDEMCLSFFITEELPL